MPLVRLSLAFVILVHAGGAAAQPATSAPRGGEPTRAAADGPSEGELEYWRSVQRIDTPAAYRTYLDSFPRGFFAGLARLRLAGAPGHEPVAASRSVEPGATPSAGGPAPLGTLHGFSEPAANSSAFTLDLGDRLNGPGVLTLGSIGARKQIVVPPGEWIVLSVADSKRIQVSNSYGRDTAAALTTLVLGRFTGNRLISLLRVIGSTQVVHVNNWSDFAGCDRGAGASVLAHARTRSGLRDECAALRVDDQPLAPPAIASDELKTSLERLGATTSGAGLISILSFGDPRIGYLGIVRIDWPGAALGAQADRASGWRANGSERSAAHEAYLKRLGDWTQAYRKVAAEGFTRAHDASDIVPNAAARPSPELSALADFDAAGALSRR